MSFQMYVLNFLSSFHSVSNLHVHVCARLCLLSFVVYLSSLLSFPVHLPFPTNKHCCHWIKRDSGTKLQKNRQTNNTQRYFSYLYAKISRNSPFLKCCAHRDAISQNICCSAPLWNRRSVQWNDDSDSARDHTKCAQNNWRARALESQRVKKLECVKSHSMNATNFNYLIF